MTVDGQDVRVSEFEYLYNKNNNQQLQQGAAAVAAPLLFM